MKRLFFISCLIFIVINVMAYQPMLVDGRIWTVSITGADPDPTPETEHSKQIIYYKVQGDSVLETENYKKVYISYNKNEWSFVCLMQEDTIEQKVWKYNNNNKDLIFDFTLNVGEELKNDFNTCQEIKYIKDKRGNILKGIKFYTHSWIEGCGYEYNLLLGTTYTLSSVEDENGIIIDCSKGLEYYNPMVVEGYSWNVVSAYNQIFPNTRTYKTGKQKIEGDSVVNDITYKKFWLYPDAQSDKKSLISLIREDVEEQKVFAYNNGVEVLLYDLGVEVGDTIKVWNDLSNLKGKDSVSIKENLDLVVDNIDFIEDPIYGTLKVVSYYNADLKEFRGTVYERYGMTTGWLFNYFSGQVGGGTERMICAFDEKDELVLKREYTITDYGEVEDCYVNTKIETNVETPEKDKSIYYNSQDGMLYIDFEGDDGIVIYDTMGKMVIRKDVDITTKSIPLNLTSGIYIVTTKNQNIYSKIVIK